jgi:hypothetical protein
MLARIPGVSWNEKTHTPLSRESHEFPGNSTKLHQTRQCSKCLLLQHLRPRSPFPPFWPNSTFRDSGTRVKTLASPELLAPSRLISWKTRGTERNQFRSTKDAMAFGTDSLFPLVSIIPEGR